MIEINEKALQRAQEIVSKSPVHPAGYRILIHPISSTKFLKAGEVEKFQTLAESGFQVQSDNQTERESKGSDFAIVVDIAEGAWKGPHLGNTGTWVKVGQIIKTIRYPGHAFEHPPGSGVVYRLINDEDVLGYYEGVVNE